MDAGLNPVCIAAFIVIIVVGVMVVAAALAVESGGYDEVVKR